MKKFFLISLVLGCIAFTSNDYVLIKTIPANATFITTDNLGNLYLVANNELKKYDNDGNLLKTYSNKSSGKLDFADVSDPLKILLYYKDFRKILFLDNTLSPTNDPILLDNLGIMQPNLVCNSYENGFWIYDQQDFQLLRIDKNLKVSNQSGNIAQLTGQGINPNYLAESSNMVYLNDAENGILLFDKFGTYSKTIPIKNLPSFQIIDDNIVYFSKYQLFRYNLKTFEEETLNLPVKSALIARYSKDRIYIMDSVSVKIFSTKGQ